MEFVDVIAEVAECVERMGDSDTLRLYELWEKTQSKRVEKQLRELGIIPLQTIAAYQH